MHKITALLAITFSILLFWQDSTACMYHSFYGANSSSYLDRSSAFSNYNRPQKKIAFNILHSPAAVAAINKSQALDVEYQLPANATNLSLQFSATDNVELLTQSVPLADKNGTAVVKYRGKQTGKGTIWVTLQGDVEGEALNHVSSVFLSIK